MRKVFYVAIAAALLLGGCKKDKEEQPGSIYGAVTDKATGEPVRTAGVQLSTGANTVTGDEGQYEFTELKAGEYTINVTKTGYKDLVNYKITVNAGKTTKGDVQIEKLPPSLRVVNDNKQDISELDFGVAVSDLTRSFNIFNDGVESIEWDITHTAAWITSISRISGRLNAGATQPIVITIDRDKLDGGENTTTIQVISDNGSKELTVKATGEYKTLPVLNMLDISNITASSAMFNGEITNTGLPSYYERGFVYSTVRLPAIETTIAKLTAQVTVNQTYSVTANDLTLDQTYYVRAYAINSVGTSYSANEISFAPGSTAPSLNTQAVTNRNIVAGTATFNGTVLTAGDPVFTERGFVYSTANNPTIADIKLQAAGIGLGAYSLNVTGIEEGYTYYVRAYATNPKDTEYGTEVSFDFIAAMPTVTTQAATNININAGTARFNGTLVSAGDLPITERGFVYSTLPNPTIDDMKIQTTGTGTGAYALNISDLQEGATYYVRAYATNSKRETYGNEIDFPFIAAMPMVTTQAVTNINIGTGTARFNGTLVSAGDLPILERGFVYSTLPNPTVDDTKIQTAGTGTGAYAYNITDLPEGFTYYVRTYATNSKGATYGNEVNFEFIAAEMPVVTTQAASEISTRTVTFNGIVVNIGDPAYTERGFIYKASNNPSVGIKLIVSGSGAGTFSTNVTGLISGTSYSVRAYAKNTEGMAYGDEISFTTTVHPGEPEIIFVQGGTFWMGSQGIAEPVHHVTLSSFNIGKYQITEGQWKAVMFHNPSANIKGDNYPVENVSWADIFEFITNLNAVTGKTYRLPTEAEWEFAAQGGMAEKFCTDGCLYSGSNDINAVAWWSGNSGNSKQPVGTKAPNELGIYDMSGNIWDALSDWYATYPSSPQINPVGPVTGPFRMIRGGCHADATGYCRVASRHIQTPPNSSRYMGFRLVLP